MSWWSQYSRGCRCNCLTSSRKKFFVCTLRHHKIMLRQKISRVNFIFLHLKSSKKSLYLFHCENQQHSYINVNSLYYSIPCANDLKCNFLHCHLLNGVLFLFIHLHRNLFHSPLKHHPCRSKLRLCLFWAFQRLCTLILKKNCVWFHSSNLETHNVWSLNTNWAWWFHKVSGSRTFLSRKRLSCVAASKHNGVFKLLMLFLSSFIHLQQQFLSLSKHHHYYFQEYSFNLGYLRFIS